ncbi:unnamed protein product [Caenorhabditis auriculariae]|uniref:Uncharacterized protein n=1 Tax=Caenorhabditis auriculariae TaxID=2777116 RepID=A0A8S1H5N0_9PELO|nr:unnamed protein product [Caenorhabditis auriculariae]
MSTDNGVATLRSGELIDLMAALEVSGTESPESEAKSLESYSKHFKTKEISVPRTVFVEKEELFHKKPFKMPKSYIVHNPEINYDKVVEYDCDEEDYEWLKEMEPIRKKRRNKKTITPTDFEFVMDRLEKGVLLQGIDRRILGTLEWSLKGIQRFPSRDHFNSPASGGKNNSNQAGNSSIDADDVCCVCSDGDVSNANQIIYCDMCNIAVHQDCYGVPYIPEGSWLCRRCKMSPSQAVSCCLCPNPHGAFKQTSDGRWAHVVCAIWLNEVHFGNAVFLEPVEGVQTSLNVRARLRCLICRKKQGACVQCSTRSCVQAFHVTCAQRLGLVMRVETKENAETSDDVDVKRFIHCLKHGNDGKHNMNRRQHDECLRRARRSLAASSYTPTINMPTISKDSIEGITERSGIGDISEITTYWYLKRKSRRGVPLIRRLQVEMSQPKANRVSSNELEDSLQLPYKDLKNTRYSMETARLLCEQVKKRENYKKNIIDKSVELFELVFVDFTSFLQTLVDRLNKKDSKAVFAQPVKLDGYSSIIKHPMDISTIRKKIVDEEYGTLKDLRKDIFLMTDNCEKFNKGNDYYLRYGRKFRKVATEVLEEAEERWRQISELQETGMEGLMKEVCEIPLLAACDFERLATVEPLSDDAKKRLGDETMEFDDHDDFPTTSESCVKENQPETSSDARTRRQSGRSTRKGRPSKTEIEAVEVEEDVVERPETPPRAPSRLVLKTAASSAPQWSTLFGSASTNKRKIPPTTNNKSAKKRKPDSVAAQTASILPFLSAARPSKPIETTPTSSLAFVNGNMTSRPSTVSLTTPARTTRASRTGTANQSFNNYREMSIASPLPADTASSEDSADEDLEKSVTTALEPFLSRRRDKATATAPAVSDSAKRRATTVTSPPPSATEETPRASLRRIRPNGRPATRGIVSSLEKAREEAKSKLVHNALVDIDGKAARVIEPTFSHLEGYSREKRLQMLATRPRKDEEDNQHVYVRFFSDSKECWLPASRITMLDLTNAKSAVQGLKQAKIWQRRMLEQQN